MGHSKGTKAGLASSLYGSRIRSLWMSLEKFRVNMKKNVNWNGAQASLVGKRVPVNAQRPVSANGNCTMRVVLTVVGTQKIRVVVEQNLGAIESKWLKIRVAPA